MSLDVAELEVRGHGGQGVAFPRAGRETAVRVRRVRRRMRPPVHPDDRFVAIAPPQDLPGEQLLRERIGHHGHLQRERADQRVERRVHLALALGCREGRDVVTQRLGPAISAERDPEQIDRFPRGAVVVLSDALPGAGEIDLGVGRNRRQHGDHDQRRDAGFLVCHRSFPVTCALRPRALTVDVRPSVTTSPNRGLDPTCSRRVPS
jgi:hypothetical protein